MQCRRETREYSSYNVNHPVLPFVIQSSIAHAVSGLAEITGNVRNCQSVRFRKVLLYGISTLQKSSSIY